MQEQTEDRSLRQALPWLPLVFLSVLMYFCIVSYLGQGYVDDTFISLRYAKNFLNGDGITWDAGDKPVEGYTSIAWVLFVSMLSRGDAENLPAAAVHGSMFWGAALIMVSWAVALFCLKIRPRLAILLPLHLGAAPFLARHGASGMETTFAAFLMMLHAGLVAITVANPTARRAVLLGLSAGLLPLVRPDALFFAMPSAVVAIVISTFEDRRRMASLLLLYGAITGCILGIYLIWKLYYYGNIVPIPAVFKTGLHEVIQHPGYIVSHWLTFAMAVALPAAIIALGAAMNRAAIDRRVVAVLAGVIPFTLYFLTVLPVKSFEFRYLFPAYGIVFLLALAVMNSALPRKMNAPGFIAFGFVFVLCNVGVLSAIHYELQLPLKRYREYSQLGRQLSLVHDITIAVTEAGQLPYYSNARVIDLLGLNDRTIAQNRFRGADFAADFLRYLETETGLPDAFIVSTPEASWASLSAQQNLLETKYDIISRTPVLEAVRKDSAHAAELARILKENPLD